MSVVQDLVTNSLKYYDTASQTYSNVFKKFAFYKMVKDKSDMARNEIIFYDKHYTEVYRSHYELVGTFFNQSNIWVWAWADPGTFKNTMYLSRKILYYGLDLDPTDEMIGLKTELITSRFQITDQIQLDIHIAIAAYLAKNPIIYKLTRPLIYPFQNTTPDFTEIFPEDENTTAVEYLYLLNHSIKG